MMPQKLSTLICLAVLFLGACAPTAAIESTQPPTATELQTMTATLVPATATTEPTLAPSITPTEEVAADFCIQCHTDKEALIQTAKLDEPVKSESEGVG